MNCNIFLYRQWMNLWVWRSQHWLVSIAPAFECYRLESCLESFSKVCLNSDTKKFHAVFSSSDKTHTQSLISLTAYEYLEPRNPMTEWMKQTKKKMHKNLMDYLWHCGLCKPIRNILRCMRYYNPHFRCVCARPDRYSPLSPANVCFLMQRVLHSFSVSSSFNISTWQWLFKRRPPGGDEEGVVGEKWIKNIHLCLC